MVRPAPAAVCSSPCRGGRCKSAWACELLVCGRHSARCCCRAGQCLAAASLSVSPALLSAAQMRIAAC